MNYGISGAKSKRVRQSSSSISYNASTGHMSSALIILTGQRDTVIPNLMNGNTRMEWVNDPTWDLDEVYFNNPINTQESTLHFLKLDNSRGIKELLFLFSNDYDIMDSSEDIQMLRLPQGRVLEMFGTFKDGELLLKGAVNFSSDFLVTESSLLVETGTEQIVTESGVVGIKV